jgi:hypothetical protein
MQALLGDSDAQILREHPSTLKPNFTFGNMIATARCGIITGRETLFQAEQQIENVLPVVSKLYSVEHPEVIFYDQACRLHKYIIDKHLKDPDWQNTTMIVDSTTAHTVNTMSFAGTVLVLNCQKTMCTYQLMTRV